MKVKAFTIEGSYKLKSEEGDVLQMQPAAGWKTIRGAKAWAEKHGYEFEQEEKGANTMASKSTITNVVVETKFNTAYVYYSTGTEKMYPADKLPKTVAKWLAEHETAEEEADPVEEEPEAAEEIVRDITGMHYKVVGRCGNRSYELEWLDGKRAGSISVISQEEVDRYREYWKEPEPTEPDEPEATEEPEPVEEATEEPELPVPLLKVSPEIPQRFPSNSPESRHNVSERPRQPQRRETKSLSLDIVDAVVGALLMVSRLSLIALAYLLMGLASTCQVVGDAVEWMTPRAASLIDRSRAAWTEMVWPACRTAAVWMAEAVWFVLI